MTGTFVDASVFCYCFFINATVGQRMCIEVTIGMLFIAFLS